MKSFIIKYILIFSLITKIITNKFHYRCGTNDLKIKPKILGPKFSKNKSKVNSNPLEKRKLDDIDEDGFKSFNIYIDKYNIIKELSRNKMKDHQEIILNALDKAAETLEKLLRVKPITDGLQFSNDDLKDIGINSWDEMKFGDKALDNNIDMKSLGIDLVIFSTFEEMDEDVIAAAAPVFMQSDNHQPILGIIYINDLINFTKINIGKYIESTLIHEMTHVLGFMGEFFEKYYKNIKEKKDKHGIYRQYITSSKVVQVARKYFNCSSIDGVELENYGDEGTAGSHWEARILLGDYMNGVAYTEEVISEFTLALLEDTGFYKPYYYTGGLMRYGKHKGCDFVYDKCINNSTHQVNPLFENEFFDRIYSDYHVDASCSSGRISRTYNVLWVYYDPLPKEYQYFKNNSIGGWGAADYCPLPSSSFEEEENAYYPGLCSGKEAGFYGSLVAYSISEDNYTSYTNKEISTLTGEEISEESFCFLSSLFKNDINDVDKYSNVVRANCYKIFCSKKSLSLRINEDYIVCPRSGGKIKVDGYKGYLLCPDYNLMCSGSVICNDLFDCVDKASTVKEESYIYDYEIKTSQNIEKAETTEEDEINNYELSNNGICPQYCKHCLENNICLKCKSDYNLLGNEKTEQIICAHKDDLTVGYFHNENDIYYKCIENCDECLNSASCEKCKDGIDYNYNKCININIPNCKEADSLGICEKCNDNYAFNGTDRNFCVEKNKFNELYFTKDNGISYFLCPSEISNCKQCEFNENVKCKICENKYILSINENICLTKEEVDNNKNYIYVDDNSVEKCSEFMENCDECSNQNSCDKCIDNFYFINNNKTKCVNKDEITNINGYYLDRNKKSYLSCQLYNQVNHCLECSSENNCSKCKSGYVLMRNSICVVDDRYLNRQKYIEFKNLSLLYIILYIFILL